MPFDIWDGPNPDHAIAPPDLSASQENAIGGVATALIVGAAGVGANARSRRIITPPTLAAAGLGAWLSAWAGATYFVGIQPVSGANIGFGMMIMAGLAQIPVALVAWRSMTRPKREPVRVQVRPRWR
ncbi:MAG: hypothetical protein ACE367_15800 [Acidimicrobiales bacterium]